MPYSPRKPNVVLPWHHAIKRWCERIDKHLDPRNEKDYDLAQKRLISVFNDKAEFIKILENGRFMYCAKNNEIDLYFILERNEIVTVWDREPMHEEVLLEMEIAAWERRLAEKTARKLYGHRFKYSDDLNLNLKL